MADRSVQGRTFADGLMLRKSELRALSDRQWCWTDRFRLRHAFEPLCLLLASLDRSDGVYIGDARPIKFQVLDEL